MVHPRTALTLAAITVFPSFIIFSNNNLFGAKEGALLHLNTKANGNSIEQTNYSWEINKDTETKNLQLKVGESESSTFSIKVTRSNPTSISTQGVDGEVCIKNEGKQATIGLQITNHVEYKEQKGDFKEIEDAEQFLNPEQINKNSKSCYPLKINFIQPSNAKHFRVVTEAIVTNPAKRHLEKAGSFDTDSFRLPKTTTPTTNTATITDTQTCPESYSCTPSETGPWQANDSRQITYTTKIENISDNCSTLANFTNEAKLTESTTQNSTTSKVTIPINTGSC